MAEPKFRRYKGKLMRIVDVANASGLPWTTVRNIFERELVDVTAPVDDLIARRQRREQALSEGVSLWAYYKRQQRARKRATAPHGCPQCGGGKVAS